MLNIYTYLAYTVINLTIAVFLIVKLKRSFISQFFLVSTIYLSVFGALGALYTILPSPEYQKIIEEMMNIIYSLFPFIFLHFILNFVGYINLIGKKYTLALLYGTAVFAYLVVFLGYIPGPFSSEQGISSSGTIFFITWMSIIFSLGVAQLYAVFGDFTDRGLKSKFLFTSFTLLMLLLPGPFSETVFSNLIGDYSKWYYVSSIIGLIIAVYIVFRHKTSANLLEALKNTLEIATDLFIQTDENLNIILAKGNITQLLGLGEKEIIGKSFIEVFDDSRYLQHYIALGIEKQLKKNKFDAVSRDNFGKEFYINFSISPIFVNELIGGYILIGRDFTHRKELEKELIELNETLEEKVQERTTELRKLNDDLSESLAAKNKMFSIIAHDLRSPFVSLLGFSEILCSEIDSLDQNQIKDFVENIYKSSTRVYTLLENLLQWSRIQTNRILFTPIDFKINDIINLAINLYQDKILEKKILINNNIAETLFVHADRDMIETVIRNLLSNALKFTREGGIISIDQKKNNDKMVISVSDNGKGISKENLDKLFKVDQYVSTLDNENNKGSGIGLILSSEFVKKNGGEIFVESEENKGSKFSFTVQLSK